MRPISHSSAAVVATAALLTRVPAQPTPAARAPARAPAQAPVQAATIPPPLHHEAVAFDEARGHLVVVGGVVPGGPGERARTGGI